MGRSYNNAMTRSRSRLIYPQRSGRKRSRGTAASGASTAISRSRSRSGLGSRLCHRRLQGEWSGRYGGGGSGCGPGDGDGESYEDGNIEDDGEDRDDVGPLGTNRSGGEQRRIDRRAV